MPRLIPPAIKKCLSIEILLIGKSEEADLDISGRYRIGLGVGLGIWCASYDMQGPEAKPKPNLTGCVP